MEIKIVNVDYIDNENPELRVVKVELSNGTKIHIESCYESYQQWVESGPTCDENWKSILWHTTEFAENINDWLHGGAKPVIF